MQTKTPELIAYRVINLPALKTKPQITKLAKDIKNEPLEIRGQTTLTNVFNLFMAIAPIADEVIYREKPTGTALIIFSRLFDDDIIRPAGVQPLHFWTDEDLTFFQNFQAEDKSTAIVLDLKLLWNKATAQTLEEPLKKFLQYLYCISPRKDNVEIKGDIPLLPALIALNWFRFFAKNITYKTSKLK